MGAPAMHIRLRKHLSAEKAYLAAKLYGRLEGWYAQKAKIARSKSKTLPWASISTMCQLMGFRDHIGSRYLIMELKRSLDKAQLIHFWKQFEKGMKLADLFTLLEKALPNVKNFVNQETSDRYCQGYVVSEKEFLAPNYSRSLVAF